MKAAPFLLASLNPVFAHQPLSFVVKQFLKRNDFYALHKQVEQKLLEHPHYPSLLSVSEVLQDLGILHQAFRTDMAAFQAGYRQPVLMHLTLQGGQFAVVERVKERWKATTEKGETHWFTTAELTKVWDGIVLQVVEQAHGKPKAPAAPADAYPAALRMALPVAWGMALSLLLVTVVPFPTKWQLAAAGLQGAGLVISWLLVLQHLNKNNALVRQLCDNQTQKGCSSVLASQSAKLTGWLSMAEAGLMFFAGLLVLTLFSQTPALGFYLALAAPVFSAYAIYLQAAVLKQWCRLCMAVHGIVLVQAVLAISAWYTSGLSMMWPMALEVIAFVIPSLVWLSLKPLLKTLKEARYFTQEYKRLKSNPDLFNALLQNQPKVAIPEELKVLSFGNVEAAQELVMVSNPFCGPCGQAHGTLHEWLKTQPDFRISLITIHAANAQDPRRQFMKWMSGATSEEQRKDALHGWFESEERDLDKWAEKHQLQRKELPYADAQLQHWLNLANVHATPTFFVNGRKLPDSYRLADIKYLIPEAN